MPKGSDLIALDRDSFFAGVGIEMHLDILIFDCLKNSPSLIQRLKSKARRLVSIDDAGEGIEEVDMVFSLLYHAEEKIKRHSTATIIDSIQYMPLRPSIVNARASLSSTPHRLFLTQGGADGHNCINRVLKVLDRLQTPLLVTPILGPAYRFQDELHAVVEKCSIDIQIIENSREIEIYMAQSAVALSGGGITCFELLCLGVPVIGMTCEEKEVETLTRLDQDGLLHSLGNVGKLSDDELTDRLGRQLQKLPVGSRNHKGMEFVDGRGIARICERIIQ